MSKREAIAVKNRLEDETLCKYWTSNDKQTCLRDLTFTLKKSNPGSHESIYETDSTKMAKLGKAYHDQLQKQCCNVVKEVRDEKITKVLNMIKTCTTEAQSDDLARTIEYIELMKALKKLNNSSVPGPDGIPYKFWKSINGQFVNDSKLNQRGGSQRVTCNLIELL